MLLACDLGEHLAGWSKSEVGLVVVTSAAEGSTCDAIALAACHHH